MGNQLNESDIKKGRAGVQKILGRSYRPEFRWI
jgi:hypothetical protein